MSSTISQIPVSAHNRRWRALRQQRLVWVGTAVILFWVLGSLIGPLLAARGPMEQSIDKSLAEPSSAYWWGADKLGRDVFVRVMYGARVSIPAGLIAILFPFAIGMIIGAVAGYVGGLWDELLMRVTDIFFAFPTIILAMAIAAALGPSIGNAIFAIAVISWPSYARVTRSLVLSIKTSEYVIAARSIGASHFRILVRAILPNCMGPLIVLATIDFGNAILVFAGLSFLGLGPSPDTPEWGRMIADSIEYTDQWWISTYPGLAIFSVVIALNFIGDGLRDILDL